MKSPVLRVRDLSVEFLTPHGPVRAVDGVSFDLFPGETLGLIGESGSGKSLTVLAAVGLAPRTAKVRGEVWFGNRDLLTLSERELRGIRGRDIAMIFQDPMTSLNPTHTVGSQLVEAIRVHNRGVSRQAARRRAVDLLAMVGVPSASERVNAYPHEFSGGMRQRVMIAMAMANDPSVLLADEPTTALDVTIQAQILEVLEIAQRETEAAVLLITHDLALVSESADQVAVMYGGKVVELAARQQLFADPRHPYTVGLLGSLPRLDEDAERLVPIPGQPPSLQDRPSGCSFHPRCPIGADRQRCHSEVPPLDPTDGEHLSACHYADEVPDLVHDTEAELGTRLVVGAR